MDDASLLAPLGAPPKHILVACGERHIGRLIEVNLERAGYRVTVAFSTQHVLEEVRAEAPDLVLLDPRMAHRESPDLLRALRADPATRGIPVCIITRQGIVHPSESR